MQYHRPLACVLPAGTEGGGGLVGFVQDVGEVPLHDPVAFQLLWHVTATVPPAVTPCHRHFVLSWELQRCHRPPCADTSLKVVSLKHPQCK